MNEHLNDDEAESLLSQEGGSDPLAATLGSIRHHFDSVTPPEPSAALSEFVSADLIAEFTDSTNPQSLTLKERTKMSLSAFVGTAAGKIIIGTSVAAASVGGAQITGVVDVPVLPDVNEQPATEVELPDIGEDTVIEVAATSSSDDHSDAAEHDASVDSVESDENVADLDSSEADDTESDDSEADDTESDATESDAGLVLAARAYDVLDVGTVTIQSDELNGLTVVETTSADGWTVEIESGDSDGNDVAHDVSVSFSNGDDRVEFKAQVENGALRVRTDDSRTDSEEEMWFDENGNPIADPDSDGDEADEADQADEIDDEDEADDSSDVEADDSSDDESSDDSSDDEADDDSSDDDSSDDDSSDDDSSDDDSSDDDSSDDDSSDDDSSDDEADDDSSDDDSSDDEADDDSAAVVSPIA